MASMLAALLTPFDRHGDVDVDALRAMWSFGIDGLFPAGTTGEGALLEPPEVVTVLETVIPLAAGRAWVLAQVGRPSARAGRACGSPGRRRRGRGRALPRRARAPGM